MEERIQGRRKRGKRLITFIGMIISLSVSLSACGIKDEESLNLFREKAGLLKEQALADWNPREANRLSDALEDALSLLEEQAPPA